MRPLITIFVFICGCPESERDTSEIVQSEAPTITMDSPIEIEPGVVVLSGLAQDDTDPAATLTVELCSDIDSALWEGNPGASGNWTWQGAMTEGEHLVSATVFDSDDQSSYAEVVVAVSGPNHAPTCAILSPEGGASFASGEAVPFSGEANDVDGDELLMKWSSDLQGSIFMGESFSLIISDGAHLITLDVEDGCGGTCQDSISISVGQ